MKCDWYEKHLATAELELWQEGRPSSAFLEHACGCQFCSRLIDCELQLKPLLAELANNTRNEEPSIAVKRSLLLELEAKRSASSLRSHTLSFLRIALAAAAIVCLVAGLILWRDLKRQPANHAVKAPAPMIEKKKPENTNSIVAVEAPPQKALAKRIASTHSRQHAQPDVSRNYYPLVMCDPMTCAGKGIAVRVTLAASPLAGGNGRQGEIMADLLVGEDGLVRGVRLLQ